MGPVEVAIRATFTAPVTLYTFGMHKPFKLSEIDEDGIVLGLGEGGTYAGLSWRSAWSRSLPSSEAGAGSVREARRANPESPGPSTNTSRTTARRPSSRAGSPSSWRMPAWSISMRARPCAFDSGSVSDTDARRHVSTSNASTGTSRTTAMAALAASGASRRLAAATVTPGSPTTVHEPSGSASRR